MSGATRAEPSPRENLNWLMLFIFFRAAASADLVIHVCDKASVFCHPADVHVCLDAGWCARDLLIVTDLTEMLSTMLRDASTILIGQLL